MSINQFTLNATRKHRSVFAVLCAAFLCALFALAACSQDDDDASEDGGQERITPKDAGVAAVYADLNAWPMGNEQTPDELSRAAKQATESFQALGKKLMGELSAAIERDGTAAAISVCQSIAQPRTQAVGEEHGFAMGRTSHLLRNQQNAPRKWMEAVVAAGKTHASNDYPKPLLIDLGDRVGVAKPIVLQPLCSQCHGSADEIAPEVSQAIYDAYPQDQARGFSVGEIRGWFWAEVPLKPGAESAKSGS